MKDGYTPNALHHWMPTVLWDDQLGAPWSRRDPEEQIAPSGTEAPNGGLLAKLAEQGGAEAAHGGLLGNLVHQGIMAIPLGANLGRPVVPVQWTTPPLSSHGPEIWKSLAPLNSSLPPAAAAVPPAPPRVPNDPSDSIPGSAPQDAGKDFRTRLREALSDANARYYLGPGFYEAFQKLAALTKILPGSGTMQGQEDVSRASEEARAGNYGAAAAHLGVGTANTALDWFPPAKVLAILGGPMAKTFPWNKVPTALRMEGRPADEMWHATGLGRGAEGNWRFEIPDTGYRLNPNAGILNAEGYRVAPLYRQQVHSAMQEAYPDLDGLKSALKISPHEPMLGKSTPHGILVRAPDLPWARFIAMHELQHTIARREGNARGGSPYEFMGPDVSQREAEQLYLRLAGEVEARNAQQRMFMSEMERRLRSPQSTERPPRQRQIVLFEE